MRTSEFLDVVCDTLGRKRGSLTLDDTPRSVTEWDSLGHLSIISAVNLKLRVPANDPDVVAFTSLRQLTDTLRKKAVLEEG